VRIAEHGAELTGRHAHVVPRAAARRDVFIRVGESVVVEPPCSHDQALATLRERMGAARASARKDALERLGPPVLYANPFHD